MANIIRRKVSLKKKRYQKDGFDLDLAYITPNILAMGFPSSGMEAMFRNPVGSVKKFLDTKHLGHYKVYNLCIETKRVYDEKIFHGSVAKFPFEDHNAPPIDLMGKFCEDVHKFLKLDETNLAAVHCKAGKGRAGMMICCYLLHAGIKPDAKSAMEYYGLERTYDGEGVTIPSQRRYVTYYDDIRKMGLPTPPKIKLTKIKILTSMYTARVLSNKESFEPWCKVLQRSGYKETELFKSSPELLTTKDCEIDCGSLEVVGDIKIIFFDKTIVKKKELCHIWFNTSWISGNRLVLTKREIDKAWNDKKHRKFLPDFEIQLTFEDAEVSTIEKMRKRMEKREKKKAKDKKSEGSKKSPKLQEKAPRTEKKSPKEVKKEVPKKEEKKEVAKKEEKKKEEKKEKKEEKKEVAKKEVKEKEVKKEASKKENPKKEMKEKEVKESPKKEKETKKEVKKEEKKVAPKKEVKKDASKKEDSKEVKKSNDSQPKKEELKKSDSVEKKKSDAKLNEKEVKSDSPKSEQRKEAKEEEKKAEVAPKISETKSESSSEDSVSSEATEEPKKPEETKKQESSSEEDDSTSEEETK